MPGAHDREKRMLSQNKQLCYLMLCLIETIKRTSFLYFMELTAQNLLSHSLNITGLKNWLKMTISSHGTMVPSTDMLPNGFLSFTFETWFFSQDLRSIISHHGTLLTQPDSFSCPCSAAFEIKPWPSSLLLPWMKDKSWFLQSLLILYIAHIYCSITHKNPFVTLLLPHPSSTIEFKIHTLGMHLMIFVPTP